MPRTVVPPPPPTTAPLVAPPPPSERQQRTASPLASPERSLPDLDTAILPHLRDAVAALDDSAPTLAGMTRYHLGAADATFAPIPPGAIDRGKRVRPTVALLCAAAAGGATAVPLAAPVAAAIELLHNFTLIHDDVQDESPTRRHRPTVWSLWGVGQAINAGDALFAAAHLPFYRLATSDPPVPASLALRLMEAFDRMTIAIVAGQTLDLGFEGRADVTPADYLRMITGKTAAIVRYAAWAGALLGGADDATTDRYAAFGLALGLGFQLRDDLLGIWGTTAATGKAAADDVRRRKQSLPLLLLRQRCDTARRAELDALYAAPAIDAAGVARVLALLAEHDVRSAIEQRITAYHDDARTALRAATAAHGVESPESASERARAQLEALVKQLAARDG